MAQLVGLTRNTETVQGYQLLTQEDMLAALTYLGQHGYTGMVSYQPNGTWLFALYETTQNVSQNAYINDWVILENGTVATVCPASKFASFYTAS